MRMKSISKVYCLGAAMLALGLASCSGDERMAEQPQARQLSFRVTVDESGAPVSRAASWEYEDAYTKDKKLSALWEATNEISVFHYHASEPQWGTTIYQGVLNVDAANNKTVNVQINGTTPSWAEGDGITALFPYKAGYTAATVEGNVHTVTISSPENLTQTGKNTSHLANYMYMYGTLPCGTFSGADVSATMQLKHIPAVLRGLVINKDSKQRIVTKVEMIASVGFPKQYKVSFTKNADDDSDFTVGLFNADGNEVVKTLTVNITGDGTDAAWNKLAATGVTDRSDRLMAYALCFPTATVQTYTFRVTTTDADGNNENAYVSNSVSSDRFTATNGALKSGYYYTFELLLDDKLTASVAEVKAMPGWSDETEI